MQRAQKNQWNIWDSLFMFLLSSQQVIVDLFWVVWEIDSYLHFL